jgi:hypothetical protein
LTAFPPSSADTFGIAPERFAPGSRGVFRRIRHCAADLRCLIGGSPGRFVTRFNRVPFRLTWIGHPCPLLWLVRVRVFEYAANLLISRCFPHENPWNFIQQCQFGISGGSSTKFVCRLNARWRYATRRREMVRRNAAKAAVSGPARFRNPGLHAR